MKTINQPLKTQFTSSRPRFIDHATAKSWPVENHKKVNSNIFLYVFIFVFLMLVLTIAAKGYGNALRDTQAARAAADMSQTQANEYKDAQTANVENDVYTACKDAAKSKDFTVCYDLQSQNSMEYICNSQNTHCWVEVDGE